MDPFWAITLSVLAISKFWKRERIKSEDRKYEQEKLAEKVEQEKRKALVERYTEVFRMQPMTAEEKEEERVQKEAERARKEAEKQKERDIAELRKQGYTDELIAVIIPTINNGQ